MNKPYLKAAERFQYYFSSEGLKEANSVPKEQSNELLHSSNKLLQIENQTATTEQQALKKPATTQQNRQQLGSNFESNQGQNWFDGVKLNPYTIKHPTYGKNLVPQFELLKEFQKRYNRIIDRKREPLLREIHQLEGEKGDHHNKIQALKEQLATDPYQKLRAAHYNLMKELISWSRETLRDMNRYLSAEGLNALQADQPFSIEISYPAMMNRLGVSAESTIYRHLRRLHVAGFLAPDNDLKNAKHGKVFHGTNAPLEVRLNPSMMLIFDKKNLDFAPEIVLPTLTENRAAPEGLRANCNHIDSLKSIGNSLIEDVRNSEQVQNAQLTPDKLEERTTEKRTPQNQAKSQFDGPASDPLIRSEIRRMVQQKRRTWRAADFGGDFQKLVFAQVFLFVQAANSTLWKGKGIYTGTLRKLEDYLIDNYFKGVTTEEELSKRINDMHKILERNARFVEADPQNRFVLLPLQYFDVKRKPIGPDDYSGFMGQLRLNRKTEEWAKLDKAKKEFKELAFERKNQLIKLKRYLRNFDTQFWTKSKFDRCRKWVNENSPEWDQAFLAMVSYNQPLPATNSVK